MENDNVDYFGAEIKSNYGERVVYRGTERLPLEPSLKLWNHSPTGFSWGYGGSGPAQLALALLLDATGLPEVALMHHQEFKFDIVASWPDQWHISREEILDWLRKREARV